MYNIFSYTLFQDLSFSLTYSIVPVCNQTVSHRFSGRRANKPWFEWEGRWRTSAAGPPLPDCVEVLLADHMLIEELQNSAVAFNLILLFGEPMAFIWKDHILHGDSILLHCGDNVV